MNRFIPIILIVLIATSVFAAPRVVLLESFTNVACGPCAEANPVTQKYISNTSRQQVLNVQYHVNWPSPSDPFYVTNPTDLAGRTSYYGISSVPDLVCDGDNGPPPGNSNSLIDAVSARRLLTSNYTISINQSIAGSTLDAEVTVTAENASGANEKLRVALVEKFVHYASPPGPNGETDFYWSVRDLLPSYHGTNVNLSAGQSWTYDRSTTLDGSWDTSELYVIAWIQNDTTKEVLQAGSSIPVEPYEFANDSPYRAAITPFDETKAYHTTLYNLGENSDIYDIHIDRDIPASWLASICVGTQCYPSHVNDVTAEVGPGESIEWIMDVTPYVDNYTGVLTITVTSQGDPTLSEVITLTSMTPSEPVLLVDADGGHNYETYHQTALNNSDFGHQTWDRANLGALDATSYSHFQAVVWIAGLQYPTLVESDRTALAGYLDGGGKMFINGQDIGWDLCYTGSSNYSPEAVAWYENYLGADYVADDVSSATLNGVVGDPIADGLSLTITGGDGASNQSYPSRIAPINGSSTIFQYHNGQDAAVKKATYVYRTVYLAFGFEGINNQTDRDAVMQNVVYWLINGDGVTSVDSPKPFLATAPVAAPNPFNPATEVSFTIGGNGSIHTTVEIFDTMGRMVKTLWDGDLTNGLQVLNWDGRNDNGSAVASGAYLARVKTSDDIQSVKMMLAK
ncbi:MAG: Omp28-related outer membrane protein [bacterium]|nr:Omp28-related outer membrane protein [bacterium]MCP4800086.1 Omp28-related outer membrane protein [bacterium]